jgi:hypothetical protein
MHQRWADIEKVGPVNALIFSETRPFHNQDAELPVLDGWAGWLAWNAGGTQMVRVKAVVRHENRHLYCVPPVHHSIA